MSIQDFIDLFGYDMKTFVQSFGLDISDVLHVFGIGFADFIKLMQYSISELLSIFDNIFANVDDLIAWLIGNLSKDVCEVINILCPPSSSCSILGKFCDRRRTAIPFNYIRQQTKSQTGNLYISVTSSNQGKRSAKDSSLPNSNNGGSSGNGLSCFPSNSKVYLDKLHSKTMEQLRVGDMILNAEGKPTKVIGWLHRNEYQEGNFVHVHFVNNSNKLTISGDHLVFSSKGVIKSRQIVEGTTLLKSETVLVKVHSVQRLTSKGVYAPLTDSGTLLVDGFACSCYAYFPSHWVANLFIPALWKLLKPFHMYDDFVSLVTASVFNLFYFFK